MGEIVASPFQPPLWLRNPHLQTLWGPLGRALPEVARQELVRPEGASRILKARPRWG